MHRLEALLLDGWTNWPRTAVNSGRQALFLFLLPVHSVCPHSVRADLLDSVDVDGYQVWCGYSDTMLPGCSLLCMCIANAAGASCALCFFGSASFDGLTGGLRKMYGGIIAFVAFATLYS